MILIFEPEVVISMSLLQTFCQVPPQFPGSLLGLRQLLKIVKTC